MTTYVHPILPTTPVKWPPDPHALTWAQWHWNRHKTRPDRLQTPWDGLEESLQVWLLAERQVLGCVVCERTRCTSTHTETRGRARSWRCDLPTDGHTRHRSISGKRTWNTKETT